MDRELIQTQKEIVALLAILVKRNNVQSTVIAEMSAVGMSPKRIGELLNTSGNVVSVTLAKQRKTK